MTFGLVSYENGAPPDPYATNATMIRIKEVTHEPAPNVVFDLELFEPGNTLSNYGGYLVYRSYRVPDLYGHPPVPVADLTIQYNAGAPLLQFTADPALAYVVQSSDDLLNWRDIGAPVSDDTHGDFSFLDQANNGLANRFYRLATQ